MIPAMEMEVTSHLGNSVFEIAMELTSRLASGDDASTRSICWSSLKMDGIGRLRNNTGNGAGLYNITIT